MIVTVGHCMERNLSMICPHCLFCGIQTGRFRNRYGMTTRYDRRGKKALEFSIIVSFVKRTYRGGITRKIKEGHIFYYIAAGIKKPCRL